MTIKEFRIQRALGSINLTDINFKKFLKDVVPEEMVEYLEYIQKKVEDKILCYELDNDLTAIEKYTNQTLDWIESQLNDY